ncbi:glycerol kinase GlpK [Thermus thermamylovorans]|uniref:Glycerol kinase n=1 Tax=Thermus thermamylovorans TaxID=2509362 RepID=A0A4Q9B5M4_9DEIN|nr:glycerol kinase GlpK [Thermus thermamylovorans]TBH21349.1 glycerol kinase [Thermus thermamylovorans]
MKCLLALDQGTTSSRAFLFTLRGEPVALAQRPFRQLYPRPGWVEHDPLEIWESQLWAAREALKEAGVGPEAVAAIGIANQRETTLVWERATGRPLHNAIVWQDRRTAPLCQELKEEGLEPLFRERTGLLLDPYFSGTKLRWLLENVPGLRERAERGEALFGTVDTWLLYRLTGGRVYATDPTNASRTLFFNLHTLSWDEELLNLLRIPGAMLPEVRPSDGDFGETLSELLGAPIPIRGVLGDQQAALFGQGALEVGQGKCTYGTGAFLLLNAGEAPVASPGGLLATVAWSLSGKPTYALEGSVFMAGAVVGWLRDGLGLIRESAEVEALAREVADSGGVYLVPAFTGLGAPYWDPHARGAILGLTRGTTWAHLARAALEGVAFQVRDVAQAMEAAGVALKELRVDGGMVRNDLFLQIQADLLGVPVLRPEVTETTALGAALMAGVGAGALDLEGVKGAWILEASFPPRMSLERRQALHQGWRRAVERTLGWAREEG